MLIHTAYVTGATILVKDEMRKMSLIDLAKEMGLENGITVDTLNNYRTYTHSRIDNKLLIDEGEDFIKFALENYLRAEVLGVTFSIPMEGKMEELKCVQSHRHEQKD